LEVSASGSRRWFWKFRIQGVEKKFALGSYPDVSLAAARKARDAAKAQKASGINPIQARQVVKLKAAVNTGDTFRETALEWFDKHRARWSGHYATREKRNLEKDLFPYFAARRISEIEPIELLAALRRVEERGALDVAGRVLMTARAVWRYAVATARALRDITADLKGALTPHKKRHFAAITNSYLAAGLASLGIIQAPSYAVHEAISAGRLVALLKDWRTPTIPVHAIYAPNRYLSAKVRVFIDWAVTLFERHEDLRPS